MKTAMQELIEKLDKTERQLDSENNLILSAALFAAKSMALELLEKEKEQIIDAYNQADLDGYFQKTYPKYAEKYYNETYNQKKS